MKTFKRVLVGIISTLLGLILIFNIYNVICLKILHKDLATINGYGILEVVSGSMEPTINIGDLIVINTKAKDFEKNDIITFYDVNGSFVTHRLVKITDDKMITKGDHNNTEDEELPTKNIVGKYVFKISWLGNVIASLKNPTVSILILVIGVLICYLISVKDNEIKEAIDEDELQEYIDNQEVEEEKEIKENKFKELFKKIFKKRKKEVKRNRKKKRKKKPKTNGKKKKRKKR